MHDDDLDLENGEPGEGVGTPQGGAAAGAGATSGNDDADGGDVVDTPQGDDDDDQDDDDELDDELDSDETDGGAPDVARARRQAARYRTRLRETETERDELRGALWRERVAALGLLADPDDLPVDPELLDDPEGIRAAADELLARKPHLRSRRIRERAGQGEGTGSAAVSLSALLAGRA